MVIHFGDDLYSEMVAEEQWKLGDYTADNCPNCGRQRLCKCANGKTRCEKCNWVVEDGEYCAVR